MCPTTANRNTSFMPTTSHREPNVRIVSVKPHMAAPPIHPTCSLVSTKCSFSGPMTALIATKVIALAPTPKQLPTNNLFRLIPAKPSMSSRPAPELMAAFPFPKSQGWILRLG